MPRNLARVVGFAGGESPQPLAREVLTPPALARFREPRFLLLRSRTPRVVVGLQNGRPIGLLAFRSVATVPRDQWDVRRVRDAMIRRDDVPLLTEDERAIDALAELAAGDVNRGLVVDNGRLVGFLSITDLARALDVRRPSRPRAAAS